MGVGVGVGVGVSGCCGGGGGADFLRLDTDCETTHLPPSFSPFNGYPVVLPSPN